MVPARLSLRNFLSYGDDCPPLVLEGIGLACLCGENGHGKSTLIDAITWALWGRARGRDMDALVHHGRRDMEVDFEFVAGKARYRVVRRRQRIGLRGTSRPSLEFQVRDCGDWRTLTEPSIAATERAIERTIKLSYETFINSALLLQGKSDLFTASGPADRKRVLAEILDLGRYRLYEERARERRRALQAEVLQLDATLAEVEPRAVALPALESEQRETSAERDGIVARLAGATATLVALRAAEAALERQRDEWRRAQSARDHAAAAVTTAEVEAAGARAAASRDEPVVAAGPAVRAGYERLRSAREAERAWAGKLLEAQRTDAAIQALEATGTRAEAAIAHTLAALRGQREEASRRSADQMQLEERLVGLTVTSHALAEPDVALARLLEREREQRAHAARLHSDAAAASARVENARERRQTLAASGTADCPLCRSPLAGDARAQLLALLDQEALDAEENRRSADARAGAADVEADRLMGEAEERRSALERDRSAVAAQVAATTALLDQARAAGIREGELAREIEALERRLAKAPAGETRRRIAALRAEREALAYDARNHREAVRRVEDLAGYEARHGELLHATARLEVNRAALARAEAALVAARDRLREAEAREGELATAVAAQPDVSGRIAALEAESAALGADRTTLDQRIGLLDGRIAEARAAAAQERALRARLAAARTEEGIVADLAAAFGKKGVQAFIIDAVLPELEEAANHLLALMTDGRMRLRLETQRETRAGDLAETLEIAITDEWGTRDYEMYSGGEAFRIDLALRIALSKLLARRAGAALPTLIIDEGFGSLDAAGREAIAETVAAIRDDFRCLLVVTHIEELKSMFDTRIEVTKGTGGSVARVVRT